MRPVRSTLSRRVRGALSPYRERGMRRLRASNGGEIPAYAGMTVMGACAPQWDEIPAYAGMTAAMRRYQ